MKEILKKHGKKILIDSAVSALIISIIVFIAVGPYNTEIVNIMQNIAKNDLSIKTTIIMFPAILVVYFVVNLGLLVIKEK